jgi:DNA repair protein RadA/Sms
MAKQVTRFICQKCGFESLKWAGQCEECKEWNSLVETVVGVKKRRDPTSSRLRGAGPIKLSQVKSQDVDRVKTGIGELDRVLGSGMVPGSVVLLAGEPGIGKSTLLTQLAMAISKRSGLKAKASRTDLDKATLYVCGEESPEQIKIRIERLATKREGSELARGVAEPKGNSLSFLSETDVDEVVASVEAMANKPGLVIVDSVQTMNTSDLTGMAGSVGQVRECSHRLLKMAKELNIPVFLVGHVTKQGSIAGPKVLEHLVDTVLYLEGDKKHTFRILRAQKNRFGSVDEVGVFLMSDKGLIEIANPSDVFLEERQKDVPGSVIVATMEGTRPVLVEIQALVNPSQLAIPRRVGTGVDQKRLQLLTAVLSKKCRIPLGEMDVYVNVAGGLKLNEPAVDLAVCLAMASSFKNKAVNSKAVVIGEVGLLGEVRRVSHLEKRVKEAKKMGYSQVIGPEQVRTVLEAVRKLST